MIRQHLEAGAAGAVVEGDGNEVTIKNITINKARRKIKVSATLAYSLDRVPQLQEIKPCDDTLNRQSPSLYIAVGDYQDAAETLAKRASEQQIISDNCRLVDPDFRQCQNGEEFIETWSKSLYSTLCAASPNPNAKSLEDYWRSILETLESSPEQCVIINCSVIDDDVLSTPTNIWLAWLDTLHDSKQSRAHSDFYVFYTSVIHAYFTSDPLEFQKSHQTPKCNQRDGGETIT